MNKSHWILVAFVATMVCNGSCRPREIDVKNIYPVYRSEKQLEPETQNRYEKTYKWKRDDDSVSYHRIDIPNKTVNELNTTVELAVKNNSKSIVDYVPVALTIKKPNIKVWPSDQNGIQSPDDLSLYNLYTNNINPLNTHHMTTPGYNYHYNTYPKPSIFILEELTTKRPFYNYDSVYTQPIQVLDRPAPPPVFYPPAPPPPQPSGPPEYPLTHWHVYRPSEQPSTTKQPPTTEQSTTEPTTETPVPSSTTAQPETTTKKRKNTRCPNVSISATTVVNNDNNVEKEGCQDINIQINTDVSNSNSGSTKPGNSVLVVANKPPNSNPGVVSNYPSNSSPGIVISTDPSNSSVVLVQNEPTTSTGLGFGFFDMIWSVFSRFFSFPLLGPFSGGISSPLSTIFTSLSAFFLPWFFPHLLLYGIRSRKQKRFVLERNDPVKYGSFEGSDFDLKTRDKIWGPRKKISRYK